MENSYPNWLAIVSSVVSVALSALIVVGVLATESDAAAETKSVTSTVDTKIVQNAPTSGHGGATTLTVDGDTSHLSGGSGQDESALLRWDLSGIAPGTKVNSAMVTLAVNDPSAQTFEAYKLKRPWDEATAIWNAYASAKPWEVAGAKGPLDRDATVAGKVTPYATGKRAFSLSPSVVQGWVDQPTSNQGVIIADAENADGFGFYSGEASDSSLRPQLTVSLGTSTTATSATLVGAGDIATPTAQNDEATAKLLDTIPGTVFTVGDNAYPNGTPSEFANYYHPTWGRHKARTRPSVGDHDYRTSGASGYFGYFGTAAGDPKKGYYSYNIGEWHAVVLNSNCAQVGGCGATSPMVTWLKNDLAANPKRCTVAYFHHPLFSSGSEHGNQTQVKPIWDALYAANADVVVNGDDHDYERFAPQNPNGAADSARGIREFVVGTGGGGLYAFGTVKANSQVRNNTTHGVLKLTLNATSYDWKFVPVAGKTFTDSGTTNCH